MRRSIAAARANRWLALFVVTRLAATAVAVALLSAREITDHDGVLIALAIAYGGVSVLAAVGWGDFQRMPAVWVLDGAIALGLVLASESWRSPFYLLALTSLVPPSTALPFKRALAYGGAFTGIYFVVALLVGIDWETLETTARLESFATHLAMPMLVVLALAYAGDLLRRLEKERTRSERLALEAERRRIALDLHDSAKQRIHAAHLVLSSLARFDPSTGTATVNQAMQELRAAAADLDANLSELRAPLRSRGLKLALRERAAELERAAGGPSIEVTGEAPELPGFLAAHAFHIVSEAMTNAARHAHAHEIKIELSHGEGALQVVVSDDGQGMPAPDGSLGHGMRSMAERTEILDGTLTISSNSEGRHGTTVSIAIPFAGAGEAR